MLLVASWEKQRPEPFLRFSRRVGKRRSRTLFSISWRRTGQGAALAMWASGVILGRSAVVVLGFPCSVLRPAFGKLSECVWVVGDGGISEGGVGRSPTL